MLDRAKTDAKPKRMQLLHCVIDNTHGTQALLAMSSLLVELRGDGAGDLPVLSDFFDLARADAGGADTDTAAGPVHQCANRLQIQVPAALSYIMGVTDPVAELGAPATNFANLCHKTEISLVIRRNDYTNPRTYQARAADDRRSVPCRPGRAAFCISPRYCLAPMGHPILASRLLHHSV